MKQLSDRGAGKNENSIFDAKPYDIKSFGAANEKYGYNIDFFETKLNAKSVSLSKGYDVVCIFVNDNVSREIVDKLEENGVKLIALRCAGYNNVDFSSVSERIRVVRVPSYSPYSIAEFTVSVIMALNRKIHRAYIRTKEANFSINGLLGFDMNGKTAGIIGTGKIARIVIKILRGFGVNVVAYDVYRDEKAAEELGFEYVELEELFKKSDIISLHCPLTKESEYLINSSSIEKMKDGVMIINTGRGKLIETRALIEGLKSKKIGSAGLDVYEEEAEYFFEDFSDKLLDDDTLARLLTFNNVLITSHQAFFTEEAVESIAETTMKNIYDYDKGNILENEVKQYCGQNGCVVK